MVKDSVGTFITKIIVMVLAMCVGIVLNRSLGADGRGQLAVILLIPQILWVLGSFGLDYANIYYAGKRPEKISVIAANSVWLGLIIGIILVVLTVIIWQIMAISNPSVEEMLLGVPKINFLLMLLTVPPYLIAYFLDSLVYGLDRIHVRNIKDIFTNAFLLLLTAVVVTDPSAKAPFVDRPFGFGLNMGIYGATLCQVIFVGFMVIYSLFLIRRFTKWELKGFNWAFFVEGLKHIGFYAYGATAATFLFHRVGILIITYYIPRLESINEADLGLFTTATNIVEKLMFIPGAIVYALLPKVTSNTPEEVRRITAKASRHTFLITLVVLTFFSIVISPILVFLYGEEFETAKYPFWYLAPGILLLSMGRIYATHLLGLGKAYYAFYFSIITLILNTILNIVFIPMYGVNGSAIATSIAFACQTIMMYIAFRRETTIALNELLVLHRNDFDVYTRGMRELWKYISRH